MRLPNSFSWPLFSVSASHKGSLWPEARGGRPEFAAMDVELSPGLVSIGQNSAAPSPEMEAEALAAV